MAKGAEVLEMLIPAGGWFITGNEYEGIQFLECEPITKEQFMAGFATVDAFQLAVEQAILTAKASRDAKLAKMGFTAAEIENW
jgi:hypothetical protein